MAFKILFSILHIDTNILAVLTAILVGGAKTGVSGMAILVVPLIAMVFPAKESVGAFLDKSNYFHRSKTLRTHQWINAIYFLN